ncbi:hypothetical protein [Pseudoxanthomonas broegbernensis]|uniref:hypothetical protein n=1 Tax=Pseudoxanthomonas broegbernensis TaxID=83619 RepID=UPI001391C383|nr:hypothetical protein [Pseudoxanthomonas broegbernensis]MBB6066168.1 hypothetical protein [Pseudoxanthomonas broegbernensis]
MDDIMISGLIDLRVASSDFVKTERYVARASDRVGKFGTYLARERISQGVIAQSETDLSSPVQVGRIGNEGFAFFWRVLALGLIFIAGTSYAQNGHHLDSDQGSAYAHCWEDANAAIASSLAANPKMEARAYSGTCAVLRMTSGVPYGYHSQFQYRAFYGAGIYGDYLVAWREAHTFPIHEVCSSRAANPSAGDEQAVSTISCDNGCEVAKLSDGTIHLTGMVCVPPTEPDKYKDNCCAESRSSAAGS